MIGVASAGLFVSASHTPTSTPTPTPAAAPTPTAPAPAATDTDAIQSMRTGDLLLCHNGLSDAVGTARLSWSEWLFGTFTSLIEEELSELGLLDHGNFTTYRQDASCDYNWHHTASEDGDSFRRRGVR